MSIYFLIFLFIVVIAIIVAAVRSSRPRGIAKEAKSLQDISLLKEETEKYLTNLEELGQDDSVSQELYGPMKENYQRRIAQAAAEIAKIKNSLTGELEGRQRDLEAYELELNRLSLRLKVGELPLKAYLASERKLRKNTRETKSEIEQIKRLLAAESSVEVRGYGGISIGKIAALRVERVTPPPKVAPKAPQVRAFPSFVSSGSDLLAPKTRLLGIIAGVVLIITIFLKWASTKPILGISLSFSGSDFSTAIFAAAIACGVIALVAGFLAQPRPRGMLYIGAGAVALITFLVIWLSGPSVPVELSEFGQSLQQELLEMVTIREGLYLYIASAIAIIASGVLSLRRVLKSKVVTQEKSFTGQEL
ncbi:MAG: hypothetical protein COX14_01225 [Chloroflexi bacterium CG23_combo_of_CG06-09_8_20_14_all_45_10]|nr:MAG: hypothetical protein COX14_01225 [Chloroflexi bacterium CG23_combo_of_CG06-09_8_20_14_all_45_10]